MINVWSLASLRFAKGCHTKQRLMMSHVCCKALKSPCYQPEREDLWREDILSKDIGTISECCFAGTCLSQKSCCSCHEAQCGASSNILRQALINIGPNTVSYQSPEYTGTCPPTKGSRMKLQRRFLTCCNAHPVEHCFLYLKWGCSCSATSWHSQQEVAPHFLLFARHNVSEIFEEVVHDS